MGYVGIEEDYYVSVKSVLDITAETGALTTQSRIRKLTPADVAPIVHGKWIFVHPLSPDDEGAYMCSECEKGDWDIRSSDKFCKFCGAKMDKEEKNLVKLRKFLRLPP